MKRETIYIGIMVLLVVSVLLSSNQNKITGMANREDIIMSFPELFEYSPEQNQNLMQALTVISYHFTQRGAETTSELLAAIIATLKMEVGGTFQPVSEYSTQECQRYVGGCDYKGRGYIQLTHEYNYRNYCGDDCMMHEGDHCHNLPRDDIKNENNIFNRGEIDSYIRQCPPARAMIPYYAGKAFAGYYISRDLITLCERKKYRNIGKRINGGDKYADRFSEIALRELNKLNTHKSKANQLLSYLNAVQEIPIESPDSEKDMPNPPSYPEPSVPEGAIGVYSIYPSAEIDIEYDLGEYTDIRKDAEKLIEDAKACKALIGMPGEPRSLTECVRTRKPDKWELADSGSNTFCFKVESQYTVGGSKPIYRFALHID